MIVIIKKIWEYIRPYISPFVSISVNLIITPVIIYFLTKENWWINDQSKHGFWFFSLLYLLLAGCVIFSVVMTKRRETLKALNKKLQVYVKAIENIEQNIQLCIDTSLINFSQKMGLDKEPVKEDRITVFGYKMTRNKKTLYGLSRYSDNPRYNQLKEKEYSLDKGCIGKGYSHGWHIELGNTPSYENDKNAYTKYFKDNYGLSIADIRDLSMHSRYYATKAIKINNKEKGIIVFESLKKDRFEEGVIKKELEDLSSFLGLLLDIQSKNKKPLLDKLEEKAIKIKEESK